MWTWDRSDLLHWTDHFAAFTIKAAAYRVEWRSQTTSRRQPFWQFHHLQAGDVIYPWCLCFLITRRFLLLWFRSCAQTLTLRCLAESLYIWAVIGSASKSLCQSHSEDQRVGWVKDQYISLRLFFSFSCKGLSDLKGESGLIYPSVRLSPAFWSQNIEVTWR